MQDRFSTQEDFCGPSQMWQPDNILIHCSFCLLCFLHPTHNPVALNTSKSKARKTWWGLGGFFFQGWHNVSSRDKAFIFSCKLMGNFQPSQTLIPHEAPVFQSHPNHTHLRQALILRQVSWKISVSPHERSEKTTLRISSKDDMYFHTECTNRKWKH